MFTYVPSLIGMWVDNTMIKCPWIRIPYQCWWNAFSLTCSFYVTASITWPSPQDEAECWDGYLKCLTAGLRAEVCLTRRRITRLRTGRNSKTDFREISLQRELIKPEDGELQSQILKRSQKRRPKKEQGSLIKILSVCGFLAHERWRFQNMYTVLDVFASCYLYSTFIRTVMAPETSNSHTCILSDVWGLFSGKSNLIVKKIAT